MGTTDLERLVVSLEASITKYEKTMAKAVGVSDKNAKKVETRWQKLNLGQNAFSGFTKGAAGAVASLLSVTAIVRGLSSALEKFGGIADQSAAAGLDPEFFQGIAYQGKLAGIEIGEMAGAMSTFNKLSGQAVENRGKMVTQLKGEHAELLKQLQTATDQEERFRLVADAIKNAKDQSEAAVIASAAFGDMGTKIAAAFKGGTDEIDRTMAKARELGIIVDRDVIAKADQYGDEWDTAAQIIDTKVKVALTNLAPGMLWLLDNVIKIADEGERFAASLRSPQDFLAWLGGGSGAQSRLRATMGDIANELQGAANGRALNEDRSGGIAEFFMGGGVDQSNNVGAGPLASDLEELFNVKLKAAIKQIAVSGGPDANWGDLPGLGTGLRGARGAAGGSTASGGPMDFRAFLDKQYDNSLEGYPQIFKDTAGAASKATSAVDLNAERLAALNDQIEKNDATIREYGDVAINAITGVVDALKDGKIEADEFGSILVSALAAAANIALPGSGQLVQAFGGLFGGGRERGGQVQAGRAYVVGEKRPELFVPGQSGMIVPRLPGGSSRGGEVIDIRLTDDSGRMADIANRQIVSASGTIVRLSVQATNKVLPDMMADKQRRFF